MQSFVKVHPSRIWVQKRRNETPVVITYSLERCLEDQSKLTILKSGLPGKLLQARPLHEVFVRDSYVQEQHLSAQQTPNDSHYPSPQEVPHFTHDSA